MAAGEEKDGNFYSVLGLAKGCSAAELKNAYRKLAKKWHPDRCAGWESSNVEEATTKFQEIQEAYSALVDPDRRLAHDLDMEEASCGGEHYGMGEGDFLDELAAAMGKIEPSNGKTDFLDELATLMSKSEPSNKSAEESFKELQDMFEEMIQEEVKASSIYNANSTFSSSSFPYRASKDATSCFDGMMPNASMRFGEKGSRKSNMPYFGSNDFGSSSGKRGAGKRRRK